jgi:hypothetical protein
MPITRQTVQKTLGELFEKNEHGECLHFDHEQRPESSLKFRIPEHQRFPTWLAPKMKLLVDSIFMNYPIHAIICSHHIGSDGTTHTEWSDVEDGQTRLSILQLFYNDGFKNLEGELFSKLQRNVQRKFENYTITIDVLRDATDDDIHEIFDRLQCGKPLTDSDRYWNWKEQPVVAYAIDLIKSDIWRHEYMGTTDFTAKKRDRLNDICGLVIALANHDSQFARKTFKNNHEKVIEPISEIQKTRIEGFLEFYFNMIDSCYGELPKRSNEKVRRFWNLGGELGMIIYDWINNERELQDRVNLWKFFINTARVSVDFINGEETLWAGMLPGHKRNSTPESVCTRCSRIGDFYNKIQSPALANNQPIEYSGTRVKYEDYTSGD